MVFRTVCNEKGDRNMEFNLNDVKDAIEKETNAIAQRKATAKEHFKENVDKERRKAQILQDVVTRVENNLRVKITEEMHQLEIVPEVMKLLVKFSNGARLSKLLGNQEDVDDDIADIYGTI